MDKKQGKVSRLQKFLSPNNATVKLSISQARRNVNRKRKSNLILGKGVKTKTTLWSTGVSHRGPSSRLGEYLKCE